MIGVDEALARVLSAARSLGIESLPLAAARGRVLAQDVLALHPLPLFTQSAVDGYALRHVDLASLPVQLPLAEPIAARAQPVQPVLGPGTAARILTGGLLPRGADTVVRQELTQRHGDAVTVLDAVALGSDIRHAGEEMPAGALVASTGQRITPGLIGALSLAGVAQVAVWRLPRIVVLVSGDEVVQGGAPLQLGQVPDANGPLLVAFLAEWGLPLTRLESVADTAEAVRDAMARAFAEADIVLTTGGVSVGDHDYIPAVAESLGAKRLLWKVAQKPGMPLYVAEHHGTLLFGLPGNPASVLVNLMVYVRAALDAMQSLAPGLRWHTTTVAAQPRRDPVKTLWLRARQHLDADGRCQLHPLGGQASHMLGNLAQANALLRVDPVTEVHRDLLRWSALT